MTHVIVCPLVEFDDLMAESQRALIDVRDGAQHVEAGAGT